MTRKAKRRTRSGEGRIWLRWHRRVGLTLSLVFLLISATGILLNHSRELGLYSRQIDAAWLYRWYGMQPEDEIVSFPASERTVSKVGAMLYLDANPVVAAGPLVGAASLPLVIVAATPDELFLISPEGQVVERLSAAALPGGLISKVGTTSDGRLAIKTETGLYTFDDDLIQWSLDDVEVSDWSTPSLVEATLKGELLEKYRGEGLSYYRVILDIHSGQFFGSMGAIVADLSALGMIMLTVTGIYYTVKYRRRSRNANDSTG
jgi:uncharacterized iron-regulated membrane protein